MEPNQNLNYMDLLKSKGSLLGSGPIFKNVKSQFDLDKKGRIKTDPITGELINPEDRRKFKNFKLNPFLITPGLSMDQNIPSALGGDFGKFGKIDIGSILNNVKGINLK